MIDLTSPSHSIIICHHTENLIHKCVASVKKSINITYEIIVVTSDAGLAIGGISGCNVIHSTELPATKRNIGADVAHGKNLVFLDDDVEIEPTCIWEMEETQRQFNAGMVFGKLYNMQFRDRFDEAGGFLTWTGFIWSRAGQNDLDVDQYAWDEEIFAGKSASCLIPRDIFNDVGGFDEDFGILGEETDLSWRVWLSGKSVYYSTKSVAYHAFNTIYKPFNKFYSLDRVHFNGCRNYITMLIKNLGLVNLIFMLPIHIIIWTLTGLLMVGTLNWRPGLKVLKGVGWIFINWTKIVHKRKLVQETRKVSDADLFGSIYRNPKWTYYTQRLWKYISKGLHG